MEGQVIDPADYKEMRGLLEQLWHSDPSDREAIEGLMKVLDDANRGYARFLHAAEVLELKQQLATANAEIARLQGVGARYADALMREKAKGAA
jgi:hypothetical protein